jgi:hypothetical protein
MSLVAGLFDNLRNTNGFDSICGYNWDSEDKDKG